MSALQAHLVARVELTMGSTRLWFPSLKSVDSQRGGLSSVLLGHDRSFRSRGLKALYFFEGSASIGMLPALVRDVEVECSTRVELIILGMDYKERGQTEMDTRN